MLLEEDFLANVSFTVLGNASSSCALGGTLQVDLEVAEGPGIADTSQSIDSGAGRGSTLLPRLPRVAVRRAVTNSSTSEPQTNTDEIIKLNIIK